MGALLNRPLVHFDEFSHDAEDSRLLRSHVRLAPTQVLRLLYNQIQPSETTQTISVDELRNFTFHHLPDA